MSDLQYISNKLRFLCTDMVQAANSGHPGAPMGLADVVTVLTKHLNINPKHKEFINRDRIVFSGGHASSMIYSLFHLWGYDVSLEDLKQFRQLGSKTPGHPEYGYTDGVEITTGPLGQGFANAVGFSMASKYAKNLLNKEEKLIDHNVYCLCGDGDLQEGISYEAAAMAGHLKLENLVVIYDSNDITIEGATSLAWSEDVKSRFEAAEWKVFTIDGHNYQEIDKAITLAKKEDKPSLIIARTIIAKGSASKEGSHKTHGAPLGDEEIILSKQKAGFNDDLFSLDSKVYDYFDKTKTTIVDEFEERLSKVSNETRELLISLQNPDFSKIQWPKFEDKIATRASNGKILNAISKSYEGFIGGSADLSPSNNTNLTDSGIFPNGKNIYFGIREHSMAAITNAIALYGLFLPYDATFFVFSDYLKPALRVAAISKIKRFCILTHDSIGVGEDGPTHQPVEQLSTLRAMPNSYTFRPCDANENIDCWKMALELNYPSSFILSRQGLTIQNREKIIGDVLKGGYVLKPSKDAKYTLLASGSEVDLAMNIAKKLGNTRVVSVPCFELFDEQSEEYKNSIIDRNTKVIAIEASTSYEWYKYADDFIGMSSFGESGNGNAVFDHFGFTVDKVLAKIKI